ncbi:MAG: hypothetical protein FJ143_17345 [Deltaproteobacteria bacterium]|nr:hypothetical protein [Deltaproteobacteria bacterium]
MATLTGELFNDSRIPRGKIRAWRTLALFIACGLWVDRSIAQEDQPLPPGAYRLEMIMASTTRVPFFGTSKSASKSVSLVEIKREGAALIQTHKACEFRVLEDSKFIKMIFPDKFVAALARHTYPLQLQEDAQGWRYRADLGIERIGYKSNGDENALPMKIDDPAVYDWDGDGKPAATLKITIPLLPDGEFYVVQRGHSILNGRIVQPGRVEGGIETRLFEQRVLGARPGFLNQSAEVQPDPKESRFILSRIADGSTCESLRGVVAKP